MDFTIDELRIIREMAAYFYFGDSETAEWLKDSLKSNEALHRIYARVRLQITKMKKES